MDAEKATSLVTFAEEARVGLAGPDADSVRATLEERRVELLEALEWLVGHDRPDDASRLAGALVPFWMATKRMDEGDASFEQALAVRGGSPAARAQALYDWGYLLYWSGQDERSDERLRAALELARDQGDRSLVALALTGLARIALRHDVDQAKELLREALEVTEGTDSRGRSSAMHVLSVAEQMSGNLAEAARLMSERIELGRANGNLALVAVESGNLSMVERQRGNLDRAEALSREALEISLQRDDAIATAWFLNGLAAVTAAQGDSERAAVILGSADAALESAGGEWPADEQVQHDGTVALLTERLGPEALEEARARGLATAPDRAAQL